MSAIGDGVAIVVPCFNSARTLAATLESAIGQAGVVAIIVVDDGSTDQSLAIARGFEPQVSVLTGPNRGVSAARNGAIPTISAEWVLFLDSDDLLIPGTVRRRLDVARATGADVVITDWEELVDQGAGFTEKGQRRSIDWGLLLRDAELATATSVWATTAAVLYSRDLVVRIGGFRSDLPIIQDARFLFDAARLGARFAEAKHVGAQYRIVAGSLSRRSPAGFWRDVLLNGFQIEQHWRTTESLHGERLAALADLYNNAVRGLFSAGDPAYFDAVLKQYALGQPLPLHTMLAAPVARRVGLRAAQMLFGVIGKS